MEEQKQKKKKGCFVGCLIYLLIFILIIIVIAVGVRLYSNHKLKNQSQAITNMIEREYLTGLDFTKEDLLIEGLDSDSDGLSNIEEDKLGTNIFIKDSDLDGIYDGAEVNEYGSDPLMYSTSGDTISDSVKIKLDMDLTKKYSKKESKSDKEEVIIDHVMLVHESLNSEVRYIIQEYEGDLFKGTKTLVKPFTLFDADGVIKIQLDQVEDVVVVAYDFTEGKFIKIDTKISKGEEYSLSFDVINNAAIFIANNNVINAEVQDFSINNKEDDYYVFMMPMFIILDKPKVYVYRVDDKDYFMNLDVTAIEDRYKDKIDQCEVHYATANTIGTKFLDVFVENMENNVFQEIKDESWFDFIYYKYRIRGTEEDVVTSVNRTLFGDEDSAEETASEESDLNELSEEEELAISLENIEELGRGQVVKTSDYDVMTGFVRDIHSFRLCNFGNEISSGGNCLGFAYITQAIYNNIDFPLTIEQKANDPLYYDLNEPEFEFMENGKLGLYEFKDENLKLLADNDMYTKPEEYPINTNKVIKPEDNIIRSLSYYWEEKNKDFFWSTMGYRVALDDEDDSIDVIKELAEIFENDEIITVLLFKENGGSHAINAYGITSDVFDPNTYYLHVYDNNFPFSKMYYTELKNKENGFKEDLIDFELVINHKITLKRIPTKLPVLDITIGEYFEFDYTFADGQSSLYSNIGDNHNDRILFVEMNDNGNYKILNH